MALPSRVASLWRNLTRRSRVERDLDDELRAHLDLLTDEKIRAGLGPAEARRAAAIEAGGVEQVKEEVRDSRAGALVDSLLRDLRYAARTLARSPGFTVVTVLTLALGIGAGTAVFSVVESALLRSLPFPDAGRLVLISSGADFRGAPLTLQAASAVDAYRQWRAVAPVFDGAAMYLVESPILRGGGPAERIVSASVPASFFPLLGGRPVVGRNFVAEEDRSGSAPVMVLSHRFWVDRFGADPHVVGRALTLDTTAYTIVGVMPATFRYAYPGSPAVWTNLGARLASLPSSIHWYWFWAIGRLKPGVTPSEAQRRLRSVVAQTWTATPTLRRWPPDVTPLQDVLTGAVRPRLLLVLGAVSLVLLIACANAAGLVLSRSLARQRLLAMRAALGAGRARLVQGQLVETALLGVAGGALGLAGAVVVLPALVRLAGGAVPHVTTISVDGRVVAASLAASLLSGLLAGVLPAWRASRLPPADVLRAGGSGTGPIASRTLGGGLIVGQLALTTILLAGAALLLRSFAKLNELHPGFEPGHVIVADVAAPGTPAPGAQARQLAYVRQVLARVAAVPGVVSSAVGSGIPLQGSAFSVARIQGRSDSIVTAAAAVTPHYFRALGIPLLRGRTLGWSDPNAIVIDSAFAAAFFPGKDPIGRSWSSGPASGTIVGLVGNVRQQLVQSPAPHLYMSYGNDPSSSFVLLAVTRGDPAGSVVAVRRAIEQVDLDVPVMKAETMTALMAGSLALRRFYSDLVLAFAAMALLLAAVGVYGLASYTVSQRTREFGVRMALGARRGTVWWLVVRRTVTLAGLGALLGLAGALAVTRTLRALLFGVAPNDPTALVGAAAGLCAVAVIAAYLPARRATRVDPATTLRAE